MLGQIFISSCIGNTKIPYVLHVTMGEEKEELNIFCGVQSIIIDHSLSTLATLMISYQFIKPNIIHES